MAVPFRDLSRRCAAWLAALLLAAGAAVPVQAEPGAGWASPWIEKDHLRLRLVSAQSALGAAGPARLGLEIRLQPGWTFYWRNPGDNGLAPLLDWSGSRNAEAVEVAWPVPQRKEVLGAQNYVYTDEVVLPVTVRPADASRPLTADLVLDYGVCKEVCVPYTDRLTLSLPPGPPASTAGADLIDWYAGQVPAPADPDGLRLTAARAEPEQGRLRLQAVAAAPLLAPDIFLEGPGGMWFGVPEVTLSQGGRQAEFLLKAGPPQALRALQGKELRATIVDAAQMAEDRVTVGGARAD